MPRTRNVRSYRKKKLRKIIFRPKKPRVRLTHVAPLYSQFSFFTLLSLTLKKIFVTLFYLLTLPFRLIYVLLRVIFGLIRLPFRFLSILIGKLGSILRPKKRKRKSTSPSHTATRLLVGSMFLMVGLVAIVFPIAYKALHSPTRTLSQSAIIMAATSSSKEQNITNSIHIDEKLLGTKEPTQPPLRIVIPKYSTDIPIVESKVIDGYWELSETTASHGIGSANPGDNGNIVVFAHAKEGLFLPLREIKKETLVYILTKDRWYRYTVVDSKLVNPNQIEVIAPTKNATLTLFTCSGFLDNKRLIVTAKPYNP